MIVVSCGFSSRELKALIPVPVGVPRSALNKMLERAVQPIYDLVKSMDVFIEGTSTDEYMVKLDRLVPTEGRRAHETPIELVKITFNRNADAAMFRLLFQDHIISISGIGEDHG